MTYLFTSSKRNRFKSGEMHDKQLLLEYFEAKD
jgi:hypothetical protein